MANAKEYSKETLNYYRICYVTKYILADGLRTIFKQEWDNRYTATKGEWKDVPRNGQDFWKGESPRNQRRNAQHKTTMINGNRCEWDCTMLFYAILYSDCIHSLNPVIRSNVDDLRKFRNEEFAHTPQGHLTDAEFQNAISKVEVAFQALGLPIAKTQEIRNQISFPTEELTDVLKKVDDLKQENHVLEDQLNKDVSSFCVLPPKPSHDVAGRDCEVANITKHLKELKKTNENKLSYLYISGNPGSGKSQLASLVAKRFFDEVKEISSDTSFVMTVNSENHKSLMESYVSFARHLKCPEYAITNTVNSNDLNTEEKITNLKSLIGTKVQHYTSWLLVVDNVTSIPNVNVHLPNHGCEQWANGQLLITTQDTQSIPLTNSFVQHISVSKGMDPVDASSLLSKLSGIADSEMEKEVAQALDYQPLALASAATYVKQVRQNKLTSNFGWNDYLKKTEKGQRVTTETILADTNPSYQKSMTVAITLAVEKVMASDKVTEHTFTLLSLCAPQPLSLDIVINYIFNIDEKIEDKEAICMSIQRCPLLLFEEEKGGVFIRVHQVVHDAINTVLKNRSEFQYVQAVFAATESFYQFIVDGLLVNRDKIGAIANRRHIVPHLQPLVVQIENLISKRKRAPKFVSNMKRYPDIFVKLAKICEDDSEYHTAKKYYNLTLQIIERGDAHSDLYLAGVYVYMGNTHTCLGDLEEAIKCYTHALDIRLEKLGDEHVDVAAIYGNLGNVQMILGNLAIAKEYHLDALTIFQKELGVEHVEVATTYHNLSNVHIELSDPGKAKDYLDLALAIRVKKLAPGHVDIAKNYNGLGLAHFCLGDLKKAEEYYNLAKTILKTLGPGHVVLSSTYINFGNLHRRLGDLQQAKDNYDLALAIYIKKLGPEHVHVARAYRCLSDVHGDLGDLKQAKENCDRALAIYMKKLGPEHVEVSSTYRDLGSVYMKRDDLKKAKQYYDQALALSYNKLEYKHRLECAKTYSALGVLQQKLGNLEQAKTYCDLALDIYLEMVDPEGVTVATAYNNLGFVLKEQGDLEQAKEKFECALAIRLKELGPEHVGVINVRRNLDELKRLMESTQSLQEMLTYKK